MTITSGPISPFWCEELIIMQLLSHGGCHRNELKKQIKKAQEKDLVTFAPHSTSTHNYWFGVLKNRGIVTEEGKILSLTNLGQWVTGGSVGNLFSRNQFAYLACDRCSNSTRIVLRTPLMNTLTSNAQDDPYVDVKCPECGSVSSQHNLGSIAGKWQIAKFYNQAIVDLGKFVKVVSLPIQEETK